MNEALALTLAKGLRDARLRAGLTPQQLAEAVGLSPQAYARMERGKRMPSLPVLASLCLTLGISAEALLGNPGTRP
jgi:transcriptional regulator with XRE-family HTH domain